MDDSFLILLLMSFILFSSLIISIVGTPSIGDVFGVFDRITGMIIIDGGGGGTTTTTKPPTTTTTLKVTTTTTTTKPPTTTIPPPTTTLPTRCYCPTSLCSGGCWWGTGGPYLCSDSACSTTTTTTTTIPTSCKVRGCSSYYPSASCQCDVACLSTKASDCCSDACSACGFCPTTTTTTKPPTTTIPPTTTTLKPPINDTNKTKPVPNVTTTTTTTRCDPNTYQNHCEGSILVECNIYGEVKRTDCATLITGYACVTGSGTAWCAKSTTTTITPKNKPPVAIAGSDQTVTEGTLVTLQGANSYDPDGTIVSYQWQEFDSHADGLTILGKTPTITVNFPIGEHIIELQVIDNDGASGGDSLVVTVNPRTCQGTDTNCGTWPNCVNCNVNDGWYYTNYYEWSDYYFQEGVGVLRYDCFEYEQGLQEYRNSFCLDGKMCNYIVQQTRTYETGNTRNKPDGTLCRDDGNPETLDYCSAGTCIHTKTTTTTLPPKGEKPTTTTTTTTLKPTTTTTVKAKPPTTTVPTTTTTTTPSGGGKGLPAPVPEPTTTTTLKPTTTTTVKAKPTTTTSTTTTTLPSCYDPDGGINTEVYGCIKLPDVILCDYCRGRTLIEFYCDRVPGGWAVFEQAKSCYDCLNGVCIPPPVNKDLSGDGIVDFIDLSLLIRDWGVGDRRSDFNQDGTVDVRDFGIFLFNFG